MSIRPFTVYPVPLYPPSVQEVVLDETFLAQWLLARIYVLSMDICTGLGVRVVLVLGARQQIDELLQKQGEAPQYAAGYRVTDSVAMQTAVQAAGASRMAVEAQLSKVHCLCH